MARRGDTLSTVKDIQARDFINGARLIHGPVYMSVL